MTASILAIVSTIIGFGIWWWKRDLSKKDDVSIDSSKELFKVKERVKDANQIEIDNAKLSDSELDDGVFKPRRKDDLSK